MNKVTILRFVVENGMYLYLSTYPVTSLNSVQRKLNNESKTQNKTKNFKWHRWKALKLEILV